MPELAQVALGIFLYAFVVLGFIAFGKFLGECDEEIHGQMRHK